jgi:hypothetical protein
MFGMPLKVQSVISTTNKKGHLESNPGDLKYYVVQNGIKLFVGRFRTAGTTTTTVCRSARR